VGVRVVGVGDSTVIEGQSRSWQGGLEVGTGTVPGTEGSGSLE
jgi:hypothetical protein